MVQQVRTYREGTLRWVQASGKGTSWATASAPTSGTFGFVQPGFNFGLGEEYTQIYNRGILDHHKLLRAVPPGGRFTILEGVTADWPDNVIGTASGATTKMVHLEYKALYTELGAASGYYYQIIGVVLSRKDFTEAEQGNTREYNFVGLTANGPTASGYLG